MNDNSSRVMDVDINDILPNRFQPRIQFDEEEILELSDSIKEHGVIQPIVVRTIGDKYEIIAGERRYKASVLAGKETVPVIVKNLNDKDSAEIALIENIQRRNLTPIEEALSYKKILDMGYVTQSDLAGKLGKSQSSVANKIRLLNLTDKVQEALLENKISERHARSLLRLESGKQQNEMLDRIISERLTVRKTDEEIDKLKESSTDDDQGEEKIIEKGEINMNNNMQGFNPQPSVTPNFDIFGSNTQSQPTQSVMPTIESQPSATPNFDIFGANTQSQPVQPITPTIEVQPAQPVQPTMEAQPAATPNFDIFGANAQPQSLPEIQPAQSIETPSFTIPTVAPVEQPSVAEPTVASPIQSNGFQFDANGNVIVAPSTTPVQPQPVIPETNSIIENVSIIPEIQPIVPETNPIMESSPVIGEVTPTMTQQSENLFSFGPTVPETQPAQAQPIAPEPIIITDYSKQYDPVMPQAQSVAPQVDFKEVINAIRECSSKIEQYGFKIDVEEYDLANLYQVIFKIEK